MPIMTFFSWKIPILAKTDPIISGFEIDDGTLLPCLLEFGKKLLSLCIHNVRELRNLLTTVLGHDPPACLRPT